MKLICKKTLLGASSAPASKPLSRRQTTTLCVAAWYSANETVGSSATVGETHAVVAGQRAAVEDPGYPPIAGLLAASNAVVVPVPVDPEGIVVDRIPKQAKLVYTTPSHQSPTGVTMSMARRNELLHFAERHDVAIIEDDYDSEYRHADRPLKPLYRLDRFGRVIYVGTFSKTLSPSLRLGFIVLPESLVAPAVNLRSLIDWQPPATLLRFIVDGHLDRHLRRTRKIYSRRHQMVIDFVHRAVDDRLLIASTPSYAGVHVTALLPTGTDETAVRNAARAEGIALGNFAQCWQQPDPPAGLIIGFGAITTSDLPDALAILQQILTKAVSSANDEFSTPLATSGVSTL